MLPRQRFLCCLMAIAQIVLSPDSQSASPLSRQPRSPKTSAKGKKAFSKYFKKMLPKKMYKQQLETQEGFLSERIPVDEFNNENMVDDEVPTNVKSEMMRVQKKMNLFGESGYKKSWHSKGVEKDMYRFKRQAKPAVPAVPAKPASPAAAPAKRPKAKSTVPSKSVTPAAASAKRQKAKPTVPSKPAAKPGAPAAPVRAGAKPGVPAKPAVPAAPAAAPAKTGTLPLKPGAPVKAPALGVPKPGVVLGPAVAAPPKLVTKPPAAPAWVPVFAPKPAGTRAPLAATAGYADSEGPTEDFEAMFKAAEKEMAEGATTAAANPFHLDGLVGGFLGGLAGGTSPS